MPDVETVDVPERVVAIADDLDIPELSFQEDEPAHALTISTPNSPAFSPT